MAAADDNHDSSINESNMTSAVSLKLNPFVDGDLIQKNKYKIEKVEWIDGKPK